MSKICQHWSAGKCNRGAACRFQHVGAGGTAAPKPAAPPPPDPAAAAEAWVRACVAENGPILASMVGRLYREAHGRHFADACGVTLNRFLRGRLASELEFEAQKGQEVLLAMRERAEGNSTADAVPGRLGRGPGAARYAGAELLVVGEADFSWSEALLGEAAASSAARLLTTTSYEAEGELAAKYDGVVDRAARLRASGAAVRHGVDARRLGDAFGDQRRFDVVAFHFPHTGTDAGLAASIDENRALLRDFLAAAAAVLRPGGEVHVTLVHRYPYTAWRAPLVAAGGAGAALEFLGAAPFDFGAYPGYHHQATTRNTSSALDVATRCLTYAWWRPLYAPISPDFVDAEATTSSWRPRRRPRRAGVAWFGVGGRTKLLALALERNRRGRRRGK